MNYIAVDTSGKHLTLLVEKNDAKYRYFEENCGVHHSVKVMTELEKLLLQANMTVENADFLAVCVGAGSFTGIRIGISTVKALAFAAKKPVLKITSFDTLAYNIDDEKILAVIDAGHNGYYVCPYLSGAAQNAIFVSGEDIKAYKDFTFVSGEELCLKDISLKVVSVEEGLIKAIEKKKGEMSYDINSLTPLYIRKSQAEENR